MHERLALTEDIAAKIGATLVSMEPTAREERIRTALGPFPEVQVAYLFGSQATGKARADSDVDVAVSFAQGVDGARRGELTLDLLAALSKELGERVDLLDLGRASSAVGFRVIRDGRRVMSRDEVHRVRLEASIARRYDDERPYRELFRRAAVRAFKAAGTNDG